MAVAEENSISVDSGIYESGLQVCEDIIEKGDLGEKPEYVS